MQARPKLKTPPSQRKNHVPRAVYDPNALEFVARHEAGHAVAAVVLGYPLVSVTIKRQQMPNGVESQGYTKCPVRFKADPGNPSATIEAGVNLMTQAWSGPAAESAINPRATKDGGHQGDFDQIRTIAVACICKPTDLGNGRHAYSADEQTRHHARIVRMIDIAMTNAERIVKAHSSAIDEVARLLMDRRKLTAAEVIAATEQFPPLND